MYIQGYVHMLEKVEARDISITSTLSD